MTHSKSGLAALVLLRLLIGWHFFYEGMVKVLNPAWSSKSYLLDSAGFAKPFFEWIAQNADILSTVDFLNAWGLTLIGFSLLIGFGVRYASIAGMMLLALYYLSHPAFPGLEYLLPGDGNYFVVNKTIIEIAALFVVFAIPTSQIVGIERLIRPKDFGQNE